MKSQSNRAFLISEVPTVWQFLSQATFIGAIKKSFTQNLRVIIGQFIFDMKYPPHFDPMGVIFYLLYGMSQDFTRWFINMSLIRPAI